MAAALDPDEVLRSTPGKGNFQRLTRLLVTGGTNLLREIFDIRCPPSNLHTILGNPATKNQLKAANLTKPQWDCLYPSPGVCGKSTDFDITLLFRLLRTICGLTPPSTGWDVLPAGADHSLTADLARIKYYRNSVYGHVKQEMEITNDDFPPLWQEISEAIVRIAGQISHTKETQWRQAINDFLGDPLTEEDNRNVEELERWYKNDMEVKKEMDRLQTTAREQALDIKEQLQEIKTIIVQEVVPRLKAEGKTDSITENVQCFQTTVGEQAQVIKDRLEEMHQPADKLSSSYACAQSTGGELKFIFFI